MSGGKALVCFVPIAEVASRGRPRLRTYREKRVRREFLKAEGFCDAAFAPKKVPESLREGFPTGEPPAMKRLGLVLVLSGLAITGAAAGSNLSPCLDPATTLGAGGDVTDGEITAARQACAHLQQSGLDRSTRRRIDHAASSLSDEQKRRQASHP